MLEEANGLDESMTLEFHGFNSKCLGSKDQGIHLMTGQKI